VLADGGDLALKSSALNRPSPADPAVSSTSSPPAADRPPRSAQEGDGHQRAGHVVQLELVETDEAVVGEGGHGGVHPDEADEGGQRSAKVR
jgi:hypothetical protein